MALAIGPGGAAALDLAAFLGALRRGAVPVDLRPPKDYLAGHIPGAVGLPFTRRGLAEALRQSLPAGARVALVTDNAVVAGAAAAGVAAAGYPLAGYLDGGMAAWSAAGYPVETAGEMTVGQLRGRLQRGDIELIDVREPHEWAAGHVAEARHVPLAALARSASALDPGREYALICATGARSAAACALLQRQGIPRVHNVSGGMSEWVAAGLPVVR